MNLGERVCRVLDDRMLVGDSLCSLSSIYHLRKDLRNALPEAQEGDYERLVHWTMSKTKALPPSRSTASGSETILGLGIERLREEVARLNRESTAIEKTNFRIIIMANGLRSDQTKPKMEFRYLSLNSLIVRFLTSSPYSNNVLPSFTGAISAET